MHSFIIKLNKSLLNMHMIVAHLILFPQYLTNKLADMVPCFVSYIVSAAGEAALPHELHTEL